MKKVSLNINGVECTGYPGQTILEVAREHGIEIPTLCHDPRLAPYAACGLCVVEMEGSPRLFRSCATEIADGQIIYTDSPRVRASRKLTLELLLSDHSGDCRPPCVQACPAHTDCQGYVGLIANGMHREALALIKDRLPLPASIGLVCPHPCETACRRQLVEEPISIAGLKLFAGELDLDSEDPYLPELDPPSGKQVAVVGAGPAGLTAAYFLARAGHAVVVFDAMPEPGGMLRYGIPEYRLPKAILDKEIELISQMGVEFIPNCRVGEDVSLEYLYSEYDAVFLGLGAWASSRLQCPGEDLPGVMGGIDFLRQVALNNPPELGQTVAIVGGGNTAMDAARSAVRLGAEKVMVLYRRTRQEMPAEDIEIEEAIEEGVEFKYLCAPLEIRGNGRVEFIRVQKMRLGEPDASGRRRPEPIPGQEEDIAVDTVIGAIGQEVACPDFAGLTKDRKGNIQADKHTLQTSLPGVFAGGDAVTGPGIAIEAIAQGKQAAMAINAYLAGQEMPAGEPYLVQRTDVTAETLAGVPHQERERLHVLPAAERKSNFRRVTRGFTEEEAMAEASRCLECGCRDYFECRLIDYANQYQVEPERLAGDKHQGYKNDHHPFIERNTQKCILCGLCVRICDEVMGVGALGLVGRGFETTVRPEFGLPLQESDCITCGQCAAICPTGALMERQGLPKNVPLQCTSTDTHCAFCSMGCGQTVETYGQAVVRVLPAPGELLCSKGRFAWESYHDERLTAPLMRTDSGLQPVSWDEALAYVGKQAATIRARYGNEATAFYLTPTLTLEEASSLAWLGREFMGTSNLASNSRHSGRAIRRVLGDRIAQPGWDELEHAEAIFMIGSAVQSPIAAVKVKNAVRGGAKLYLLAEEATLVDNLVTLKVSPDNSRAFLKEMLAHVIDRGMAAPGAAQLPGYQELARELAGVKVSEPAARLAEALAGEPRLMILIDGFSVSGDASILLADLALLLGQVGRARTGIITVAEGANSQGLLELGVTRCRHDMSSLIAGGAIKLAMVMGEDPLGAGVWNDQDLQAMDLLVVAASSLNATARQADVVFPLATPLETDGHYLLPGGVLAPVEAVTEPPAGLDNLSFIERLAWAMGAELPEFDAEQMVEQLPRRSSPFDLASLPINGYVVPGEGEIFCASPTLDPALQAFATRMSNNG